VLFTSLLEDDIVNVCGDYERVDPSMPAVLFEEQSCLSLLTKEITC
jgi:hypothetical protein